MRLDAEHDKRWRHALFLACAATVVTAGACTKSWVLGPEPGAGGAGAGGMALPSGSGGFTFPGGSGGFTADHGGTGGHTPTCTTMSVGFDIPKTNMALLVGRDTSMSMRLGGGGSGDSSRMAAVQSQLKSLITTNQYAINFGYLGFPSLVACPNGMACCANGTEDGYAPPQGGAALSIMNMLTSCLPGTSMPGCTSLNDARPVAQALQAADGIFSSSSKNGDRVVLLIADGAPGCATDDPSTKCAAEKQAVATLYNDGIRTYVIAIGDDAQNDSCLQQIAGAGSSTMPTAVSDTASLMTALTRAMALALSAACTVELTPGNYDPDLLSVRLGDHDQDHEIPPDSHDGWTFAGSFTRIKLNGASCMKLQTSPTLKVSVNYGCPPCSAQLNNCD